MLVLQVVHECPGEKSRYSQWADIDRHRSNLDSDSNLLQYKKYIWTYWTSAFISSSSDL